MTDIYSNRNDVSNKLVIECFEAKLSVGKCLCDILLIFGYIRPIEKILDSSIMPSIVIQICFNYTYTDIKLVHKIPCDRKLNYSTLSYEFLSQISNHNTLNPPKIPVSQKWQSLIFGKNIDCSNSTDLKIEYKIKSLCVHPACFFIGF
eukprot:864576_1